MNRNYLYLGICVFSIAGILIALSTISIPTYTWVISYWPNGLPQFQIPISPDSIMASLGIAFLFIGAVIALSSLFLPLSITMRFVGRIVVVILFIYAIILIVNDFWALYLEKNLTLFLVSLFINPDIQSFTFPDVNTLVLINEILILVFVISQFSSLKADYIEFMKKRIQRRNQLTLDAFPKQESEVSVPKKMSMGNVDYISPSKSG